MASDRQGRLRRAAVSLTLILVLVSATASAPRTVDAYSHLTNGGFENGTTGWSGGIVTDGCTSHTGAKAGALRTTVNEPVAVASQTIVTSASGAYTLTGYLSTASGRGDVVVSVQPFVTEGSAPHAVTYAVRPGSAYVGFSIVTEAPVALNQISVRISLSSDAATVVCVDDLALEGPPPATPTPTPTATSTSTPTSTPAATSTALAPVATTSAPPAGASATAAATAAPARTSTPAPTPSPGVAATLLNGGFEDGLTGWQKFGGELRAVTEPHRSGGAAGLLSSTTSSTKWAFQVVRVDPAQAYEFAGYLQTDAAVSQAYLRISWYAAADGSGSAIATDDSTATLTGGTAFAYVTTGPRRPPADAHTARLRVMLAPAVAGAANLYLDDLILVVGPPTAAAAPATTTVAANEPVEAPAQPPALVATPSGVATAPPRSPSTTPGTTIAATAAASTAEVLTTPVAQVAGARVTAVATAPRSERLVEEKKSSSSLTAWLAVLALPLFGLGAGAAYIYGRRNQA